MKLWPKRRNSSTGPAPVVRGDDESDADYLRRLATAHLPEAMVEPWLGLLRPAIRLVTATDGHVVVARLGGTPRVGSNFEWPTWEGHGPLAYVGEVDLVALESLGLDLDLRLPPTGRLLAFYFDGSYDDFNGLVGTWDRESLAGARLLHLLERREDCTDAAIPPGVLEFKPQDLTGRSVITYPNWEHPALRREFGTECQEHNEWMSHPVNAEPFVEALFQLHVGEPRHQVGGWADPEQGPVEFEVAQAALDEPFDYGDTRHTAEALAWSLVLQVDSDDASDMMWGDVGALYWLARPNPSDAHDITRTSFTWQCG